MNKSKCPGELKEMLSEFEREIEHLIAVELNRIGQPVSMNDINENPFNSDIKEFIHAIRTNEKGDVIADTHYLHNSVQHLSDLISDNSISHHNLISLLETLKTL